MKTKTPWVKANKPPLQADYPGIDYLACRLYRIPGKHNPQLYWHESESEGSYSFKHTCFYTHCGLENGVVEVVPDYYIVLEPYPTE